MGTTYTGPCWKYGPHFKLKRHNICRQQPTYYLSVFWHFMGLALKRLMALAS